MINILLPAVYRQWIGEDVAMFIDNQNKVDREGLRIFVLEQLQTLKQSAQHSCVDNHLFWDKVETTVKKTVFGKENVKTVSAIKQITHLPFYIQLWIDTAVDTQERFDFFVLTKAHEMKSGDQERDYFWAMQIRHDQLLALVRVMTLLLEKIKVWITESPTILLDDAVFLGIVEVGIEEQVYLEAENIYKERQGVTLDTN